MTNHSKPITKEIRNEILTRTLFASSRQEVTRSIFETIVDAGIDWRTVSVDDVKPILVDALRAFSGKTVWIDEPIVV
jgi:hypothetical protein